MNIADLRRMPDRELLQLLAVRQDLLRRVWSYREPFMRLFAFAYSTTRGVQGDALHLEGTQLVANTMLLLRRPDDVLHLCECLDEDEREPFLDMLVMHTNVEPDVVAALVSDTDTFAMLPRSGSWVGHAIWRRGVLLMKDSPEHEFEIDELIPLGLVDGSARSLLGAALDAGQLTEAAIDRLLGLFPNDRYVVGKFPNCVAPKGCE